MPNSSVKKIKGEKEKGEKDKEEKGRRMNCRGFFIGFYFN